MKSTTHVMGNNKFTVADINERISYFKQEIAIVFESFAMKNMAPSVAELKGLVNQGLGCVDLDTSDIKPTKRKAIRELLDDYLAEGGLEKNWDDNAKKKYTQAVNHLMANVPHLRVDRIKIETIYKHRD